MKLFKRFSRQLAGLLALILILSIASSLPTLASSPQTDCLSNGGTWQSLGGAMGVCTYPAGNAIAVSYCGQNHILSVLYIEGSVSSRTCTPVSEDIVYLGCQSRVDGPNPDPVVVYLCWGYNGFVKFPAYVCPQSCLIGFILPYQAAGDLPSGALATLYVQLDDTDGSPYNGTYTACFENDTGEYLTIYRYVSGEWRALNTSRRSMVCATVSGDGSFYLGYPPA